MNRSLFDEVYFILFLATAWRASACIHSQDWIGLTSLAIPFVSWTLWRGGLRSTR